MPPLYTSVANDLRKDQFSPISPILQIQLSEMWEIVEPQHDRKFNYKLYKKVKRDGAGKLKQFFEEQMEKLEADEAGKKSSLKAYVQAGLALDLLYEHTTPMGTAAERSFEKIQGYYISKKNENEGEIGVQDLQNLIQKLIDLRLLLRMKDESKSTRLAHDTLAPIIRIAFISSQLPGQRAAHILDSKIQFVPDLPEEENTQEPKKTASPDMDKSGNSSSSLSLPSKEMDQATAIVDDPGLEAPKPTKVPVDEVLAQDKPKWFSWLLQKIEELASAKADDSDPKVLTPANLRIIKRGKQGMRKWEKKEQWLVDYNEDIQNEKVRQRQFSRLIIVGLGIIIAGIFFWSLRNLAGGWEQNKLLNSIEYLMAAEKEIQKGGNDTLSLFYTSQAYLYNFPHEASHILDKMIGTRAENSGKPEMLIAVDTIEHLLEHAEISPDGRFALTWGGVEAQLIPLEGAEEPIDLAPGSDTVRMASFAPKGNRVGLITKSEDEKTTVKIWTLGEIEHPEITRQFPYSITCMDFAPESQRMALGGMSEQFNPIVLMWDYNKDRIDDSLYLDKSVNDNFELVAISPDETAIVAMRDSAVFMDGPTSYFWHFDGSSNSIPQWIGEYFYFMDFHPKQKTFVVTKEDNAIRVYDYADSSPKRKQVIELPGYKVENCLFNTEGDFILSRLSDHRSRVFNQNGKTKDIFEFEDTLKLIQTGSNQQSLFFLCQNGIVYEAPLGISPVNWIEKQRLNGALDDVLDKELLVSSKISTLGKKLKAIFLFKKELNPEKELPVSLQLSKVLSNWQEGSTRLFNQTRLLMLLFVINFIAHFHFSRDVWKTFIDWINKKIRFVTLNFWPIVISNSFFFIIVSLVQFMDMGMREGSILETLFMAGSVSMLFNLIQMRINYRDGRYLSFYAWLFFFLFLIFLIGYFTFNIDKYDLFTMEEFKEAIGDIFRGLLFFLIGFNIIGHYFLGGNEKNEIDEVA